MFLWQSWIAICAEAQYYGNIHYEYYISIPAHSRYGHDITPLHMWILVMDVAIILHLTLLVSYLNVDTHFTTPYLSTVSARLTLLKFY